MSNHTRTKRHSVRIRNLARFHSLAGLKVQQWAVSIGMVLGLACFSSVWAGDDAVKKTVLPSPEPTPAGESPIIPKDNPPAEETPKESVKKAENIDLKEIVNEPLALPEPATQEGQATAIAPVVEPLSDAELNDEGLSLDELPQGIEEEEANIARQVLQSPVPSPSLEEQIEKAVQEEVTAAPDVDVKPSPLATVEVLPEPNIVEKIANELTAEPPEKAAQKPLVLLNSEVLAGTSTRLGWSPSISFMGISAPTAVLVLNGVSQGPTLCLTAAVHGDELNGIEIVRRVLYNIDPQELSGAIIGVPIVNLQGFRRSSRYLPDRRDLNRFFPGNPQGSSAARIAHSFFSEVIKHCDYLVDLHTGSFRRTNLPQIRADLGYPEVASLTKKMGSIVVVQSKGAVGSLRRAAVETGIPAITLEAGAPHELQKDAVEHGVKSVETAMDGLGMIDRRRFWERAAEPVYYQSVWVRAKEGGILFSEVSLGAYVREGTLLGTVTDPITNNRSEIQAPFDGRIIGMALNQVMFPGFAAYHVGLKASVEEAAQEKPVMSDVGTSETGKATLPQEPEAPLLIETEVGTAAEESEQSSDLRPIEDS